MRNANITMEKLEMILKDRNPAECDWKIVYDIFGNEHINLRCNLCPGFGHVNDTYCSSYLKNGK